MISIVICNRSSFISPTLAQNIAITIGVKYEIIVIDNSKNQYDIFQAYNEGVAKAQYPIICFMHDDILYHTNNWGKRIVAYFQDMSVGMVGISGPTYMCQYPGVWWGIGSRNSTNSIRQYNLDTDRFNLLKQHTVLINPYHESSCEVVAVDGLFFVFRKNCLKRFLLMRVLVDFTFMTWISLCK